LQGSKAGGLEQQGSAGLQQQLQPHGYAQQQQQQQQQQPPITAEMNYLGVPDHELTGKDGPALLLLFSNLNHFR
jgi:hypothetical protein